MSAKSETYSLVVKRPIVTQAVAEARETLRHALSDAIAQSGLYRDEAEGRLSLFLAYLWDDFEPVIKKLPAQRDASKLGLSGVIQTPKIRNADLGLAAEPKKKRRGRPREDGSTRVEERLAL